MVEKSIKNITVIGTGVIGTGWIIRFLANGYSVTAVDLDPETEASTRETVARVWPKMEQMGLRKDASQDNLKFESDMKKALANADFVQENVPEREELKRSVIANID